MDSKGQLELASGQQGQDHPSRGQVSQDRKGHAPQEQGQPSQGQDKGPEERALQEQDLSQE